MAPGRSAYGEFNKTLAIAVGVLVLFTILMIVTGCRIPRAFEMYSDGEPGGSQGGGPAGGAGVVMQYFRMDGCPHCERFDSVWGEIKAEGAALAKFEVHEAGGAEAEKHGVRSFPHLQKVVGGQVTEFDGKREKQAILQFLSAAS